MDVGNNERVLECRTGICVYYIGNGELTRRSGFAADFNAAVAFEALRGDQAVQEITSRHKVPRN